MANERNDLDLDSILNEVQNGAKAEEKPKFVLNLDLDSEYGEAVDEPVPQAVKEEPPAPIVEDESAPVHKKDKKEKKGMGCLKGAIYAVVVLVLAGLLAYVVIIGGLDFTGITRENVTVDINVPAGANTQEVAELLKENGLIDQPLIFRVYARISGADGKWQPGGFSVQPDMGYSLLIESLQTMKERKTVKVTIPEGFTVYQIAERLERKGVCTTTEFYRALAVGDFSDYDFIAALDTVNADDLAARYYKMEGYLFPDTYEFYAGCSGESAVRKFLDGFKMRLDTSIRASMQAKNLTMDELIILASIVQGEAASKNDMQKVARVLWNRLENTDVYPKLQCDSTGDYVTDMMASGTDIEISNDAYDTYVREGLPVGAINNPGLDAVKAVLAPSEDADTMQCYFFATDYLTGKTYYSKTYAQHQAVCRKYGIGMYG